MPKKIRERFKDITGCENNPGLELFSLNPQTVSQNGISRLIFVAHRTGKLASIKKTRDARQ